jgi:hypothetical protein
MCLMSRLLVIRLLLGLVLIPLAFALLFAPQLGMARLLGLVMLGVFGVANGALQRRGKQPEDHRSSPSSSWR